MPAFTPQWALKQTTAHDPRYGTCHTMLMGGDFRRASKGPEWEPAAESFRNSIRRIRLS
jgi:hypothetical protein